MSTLLLDLRYALRALRKSPGFTLVAVLTLALGIGANTAIFSLANGILFRPLPFAEPERLVAINARNAQLDWHQAQLAYPTFADWQRQSRSFVGMAAYNERGFNLSGAEEPERVGGATVSAGTLRLLGVQPLLGRDFLPEEDRAGAERVALIGHDLWERHFGSDPRVVGRTVRLDGESFTVVGVMPPGFRFPESANLWVPVSVGVDQQDRRERSLSVIARLREGVSVEEARAELAALARAQEQEHPEVYAGWSVNLRPLNPGRDEGMAPVLFALLGAVGFVLLIACANVGNLLLVRVAGRQREIALRAMLGASRRRLIRQLLTESVLLALLGGVAGLLLAVWAKELLFAALPAELPVPYWIRFDLDVRVLAFTLAAMVITVLAVGLAPALQASRPNLGDTVKEGSAQSTSGRRGRRLRTALVVSEVALSLVLLVGAGLMIRSLLRLQGVSPGIERPEQVLTLRVALPEAKYPQPERAREFFSQLLGRLEQLPGVERAAAFGDDRRPAPGSSASALVIEGQPALGSGEGTALLYQSVSPGYFAAVGQPVRRGREFAAADHTGAPAVAVINEALARRFWQDEDPLGRRLRLSAVDGEQPWLTVVGVVADVRDPRLDSEGVSARARPQLFLSSLQAPQRAMTLVVRSTGNPLALAGAVRREILAVDPDQPVAQVMTLERYLSFGSAPLHWIATLFVALGGLALALATLGIYGVVASAAGQRTHEIGIRMALGATAKDVLRLVLGQGLTVVLAGVGVGLLGALGLTQVLAMLLYEVTPTDPLTYGAIALLLTTVALLASYLPARRATRVDPMIALRNE